MLRGGRQEILSNLLDPTPSTPATPLSGSHHGAGSTLTPANGTTSQFVPGDPALFFCFGRTLLFLSDWLNTPDRRQLPHHGQSRLKTWQGWSSDTWPFHLARETLPRVDPHSDFLGSPSPSARLSVSHQQNHRLPCHHEACQHLRPQRLPRARTSATILRLRQMSVLLSLFKTRIQAFSATGRETSLSRFI